MKTALLVAFVALLVVSTGVSGYAKSDQSKYGGFDVTITHTGPGTGTFTIVGENANGSADVAGTFESTKDPDTGERFVSVVFDAGSVVICADGTVYDLSGQELTYAADASANKIIHTVINYIKTLLEG
jgi:hypothetical protein